MDPPPDEPPGLAFRDELVPWLEDDDDDDEGEVLDLSRIGEGDEVIDEGVTSGADPSAWDPILVDPPMNED